MTTPRINAIANTVMHTQIQRAADLDWWTMAELAEGEGVDGVDIAAVTADEWDQVEDRVIWLIGFLGGHLDTLEETQ